MSKNTSLVGMLYLTRSHDEVSTQGLIESRISVGHYIVQPFSWLPSPGAEYLGTTYGLCGKYLVSIEQMAMEGTNWEFFKTEEELVARIDALGARELVPLGPPGATALPE